MSAEIAAVIIATLVSSVAAFGLWLRFKTGEQKASQSELLSRLSRLEGEVRSAPLKVAPNQLPMRMGMR